MAFSVKEIIEEKGEEWGLRVVAGKKGLRKKVTTAEISRPGLLFAGFDLYFPATRVQLIGKTEFSFLQSLSKEKKKEAVERLYSYSVPVIFFANGIEPPQTFVKLSNKKNIPLIQTKKKTTDFSVSLSEFISFKLAPSSVVYGTLVDVYGVGILLTGRSGIGKSECALDLIDRGHVLVADDAVKIVHYPKGTLVGFPVREEKGLKYFIEIRGVGLVDIYSLYGVKAVRDKKKIEIHVELIDWSETLDYERIGIEEKHSEFLGVRIPHLRLPLNPGKNVSIILEVIAMNYLLKRKGYSPAEKFEETILSYIKGKQ